ncbi:MAG: TonB-dependent receptor [Methylobacillus sp.]|jgi:outer membrane receptor protein involved in Fe transport|nr:TonB-dependent receptor [Methylobacillus sp.]
MQHLTTFRLRVVVAALACALPQFALAENKAEILETGTVDVVSTTPLPSVGTTLDMVPSNVQTANSKAIAQQHTLEVADYMNANLGSVTISEGQSNVYMPDVNFRGFTATPLMGAPVGMSVYIDGVRVNEPFGDGVNWAAIPQSAISGINLIPGSNPVFGLNTLGGALSVHTKSGEQYPGGAIELNGGSWGRTGANFEYGGSKDEVDWFLTGNFVNEDGWREHSTSNVNQLFGKLGWQNETSDLDLSISLSKNLLEGVQAVPKSWGLRETEGYTWPDRNDSTVTMLNLKGSHFITDDKLIAGNVYFRRSRVKNFASNTSDDYDPDCDPALNPGTPACPLGAGEVTAQGFNERSALDQQGYGFALQFTDSAKLWAMPNQFTVGFSYDGARSNYQAFTQDVAQFDANRAANSDEDFGQETDVVARNHYYGVYFTDTLSLTDKLHVTASGRYNYIRVSLKDRMEPDGATGKYVTGTESSRIEHQFNRFNPALGVNYNPSKALNFFGGYNEGMRAPTPIELACADPEVPCRLPTDFLADPSLKPVVAKTWEGGVRGLLGNHWQWNATGFYSTLHDDIQFISATGSIANTGYFQNVGKTRRQGVELGLQGKLDKLTLAANYTYLRATFESDVTFNSAANSSANAAGEITARPGNRMPNLPDHALKLRAAYDVIPELTIGLNMLSFSGVYARGDENNQDANGKVAGYTIFNMDANWRITSNWSAYAKVNNLFDKEYSTLGVLGTNAFNTPGRAFNTDPTDWASEQFRSPGAPRAAWVGVRYEFGRPNKKSDAATMDMD